jgi:hypothetical protein
MRDLVLPIFLRSAARGAGEIYGYPLDWERTSLGSMLVIPLSPRTCFGRARLLAPAEPSGSSFYAISGWVVLFDETRCGFFAHGVEARRLLTAIATSGRS